MCAVQAEWLYLISRLITIADPNPDDAPKLQ